MKFLSSILLLILSFNAFSQINIFIKDETNSSFSIGIDGYSQNDDPKNEILIGGLDTSRHLLQFQLENEQTAYFSRFLKLNEKGNYQYVIVKNFKGIYQLRYRGKFDKAPAHLKKQPFSKLNPWIEIDTLKISIAGDTLIASAIDTTLNTVTAIVDSQIVKVDSSISTLDTTNLKTNSDSLHLVGRPLDISKVPPIIDTLITEPPIDPFSVLISDIQKAEFEFNRLNLAKNYLISNSISTVQIIEVFNHFKYDNTRIQFLDFAVERLSDKENIKVLEGSFDYELSKDQFRTKHLK